MDKEVATRSKSTRINRSRNLNNHQDRKKFLHNAQLVPEDDEALSELDSSLFELEYNEDDIEYIYIPPKEQNPFYGIEEDIPKEKQKKSEITWKK